MNLSKRKWLAVACGPECFHHFQFNREEFLSHYHMGSNVESTFSMIKAKLRDHVRAKKPTWPWSTRFFVRLSAITHELGIRAELCSRA